MRGEVTALTPICLSSVCSFRELLCLHVRLYVTPLRAISLLGVLPEEAFLAKAGCRFTFEDNEKAQPDQRIIEEINSKHQDLLNEEQTRHFAREEEKQARANERKELRIKTVQTMNKKDLEAEIK